MRFLITGHSRSGTKYMSHLMACFGFDVGHERMRKDGISAWQLGPPDVNGAEVLIPWECPPWYGAPYDKLIQVVREPFAAIPSILYTDFCKETNDYKRKFIDFPTSRTKFDPGAAALSYVRWNAMIRKRNPDLTVRVEDSIQTMRQFFGRAPTMLPNDAAYNRRLHNTHRADTQLKAMDQIEKDELREFCEIYGYDWPA